MARIVFYEKPQLRHPWRAALASVQSAKPGCAGNLRQKRLLESAGHTCSRCNLLTKSPISLQLEALNHFTTYRLYIMRWTTIERPPSSGARNLICHSPGSSCLDSPRNRSFVCRSA